MAEMDNNSRTALSSTYHQLLWRANEHSAPLGVSAQKYALASGIA